MNVTANVPSDRELAKVMPKVVADVRPLMVRCFLAGLSMATVADVFGFKMPVVEELVRLYGRTR